MADGTSTIDAPIGRAVVAGDRVSRGLSRRAILLIAGPLVLIAVAGWLYFTGGRFVSTDNAYIQADMVQLSTDVSGTVREIDVADNQQVKAGQVLFRLDDSSYRFALQNATANLGVAMAEIQALKANWREKQQDIKLAQVDVDFTQKDWDRKHDLFTQHVVPQSAMDMAQQALDRAKQKLQAEQQELSSTVARLDGNVDDPVAEHPRVQAAQAQVDEARRNLDNTVVRAPVDGVVTNVPSLQVGHFLPASTAAFSLVSGNSLWIEANLKETQLTYVRPGQHVAITVDTYPGVTWDGLVQSVSPASGSQFALLPAQNTSGNWVKVVQRIPVRVSVAIDPNKPVLRSGMSTEIEIDTGHKRTFDDLLSMIGL